MRGEQGGPHITCAVGVGRALARDLELAPLLVEAVRRAEVGEAILPEWEVGRLADCGGCGTAGDCDGADEKKTEKLHFQEKRKSTKRLSIQCGVEN